MKPVELNKIPLILLILALFYTASLFIVPLTLEPGTVEGLDGAANRVVYMELWKELPTYHAAVYTFSDFNCHQMHERSYYLNGNQMPVCARCVGIFIGLTLGFFAMMFITPRKDYKDMLMSLIPMETEQLSQMKKRLLMITAGAAMLSPMAADGFIQLLSDYESNNPMRTVTGILGGVVFSLFMSALLVSSIYFIHEEEEKPYI